MPTATLGAVLVVLGGVNFAGAADGAIDLSALNKKTEEITALGAASVGTAAATRTAARWCNSM